MRRLAVTVLVTVLAATACSRIDRGGDAVEVFDTVAGSTVLVEVGATNGSGFVIEGGYVVTNQHVVGVSPTAAALVPGTGEFVDLDVVGVDVHRDLAVLGPLEDPPPALEWADSAVIDIGEEVWTVGYPGRRGLDASPHITGGLLAQRRNLDLYETTYLEFSDAVAGGQSGGPFVDADGAVLGVSTLQVTEARFLVALSSEDAQEGVAAILSGDGAVLTGDPFTSADVVEVEPQGETAFRFQIDEETDLEITVASRLDLFLEVIDPAGYSFTGADDPPVDYFDPSARGREFENDFYVDVGTTGEETLEATLTQPGVYFLIVGSFSRFGTANVEIESNVELEQLEVTRDDEPTLEVGEAAEGMLVGFGDSEAWSFDADEGVSYRVRVEGIEGLRTAVRHSSEDVVASAAVSSGETIGFNLDFEFEAEETGTHQIEIGAALPFPVLFTGYRVLVEEL